MQNEEAKLKKKVNKLIDHIATQTRLLKEKNEYIQQLENELMVSSRENGQSINPPVLETNDEEEIAIISFLKDFYGIANYTTKNSESFYKIEQNVFDDYICKYARIDLKSFITNCVDLMIIKAEKNRKCVYNSGESRVYYVSRSFMEAAVRGKEGA